MSMLKRKADIQEFNSPKKIKNNDWISGTSVANYLNGEPLLDWLNLYYNDYKFNDKRITRSMTKKNNNTSNNNSTNKESDNPLFHNGLLFESKIYIDLEKKFGDKFVQIHFDKFDFDDGYKKTLKQIEQQTPIIAQAVLVDYDSKMRGVADLLVRSDYVNKIFKKKIIDKNMHNELFYIVIDIKWTSMVLCVDGKTIRNDGRFKAYKGQLYIYNYILGKIQNYMPPIALIMAKNWKIDSKYEPSYGYSCYDVAGIIDYSDKDNIFVDKTLKAIEWINNVRINGLSYCPLNPTIKEMCVNASNHNDNSWTDVKKEILEHTKDITQVWHLTQKHRDCGFDKNIKSWDDLECTTENLEMNDSKTSNTIDKILDINRQNKYFIYPNKLKDIKDNRFNWKKSYPTDFFIDFETTSELLSKLNDINIHNSKINTQLIFMIGVGYVYDDKFHYKCFKMNELNLDEERRILTEFKNFIDDLSENLDAREKYTTRLFHWSNAEQIMLENAFTRHNSLIDMWQNHIEWIDLCEIFTSEPIVVKGSVTFKLKDITNALFSHGLIKTNWNNSEISDGISAMTNAMKYYDSNTKNEDIINNIMKYNKIDCKVLWEILDFLRNLD